VVTWKLFKVNNRAAPIGMTFCMGGIIGGMDPSNDHEGEGGL